MKQLDVDQALHAYIRSHSSVVDPILDELLAETRARFPEQAVMSIAPLQGLLMTMLVGLGGGRRVLEVGTFTGASALCLARGLAPGGRLECLELDESFVEVGRPYWRRAGVEELIEVSIGDARAAIRALPREPVYDLVFIDADKPGYPIYVEESLARLREGGLILVDNVLWSGVVADDPTDDDPDSLVAIRSLNERLAADPELECVMLPVADGLTLVRPRGNDLKEES